jgi:FkbM family methyltransferase
MARDPIISYAQNREDVVLWRALGDIERGRYVEIGANDPRMLSVTRAFYDRGWSGVTVEPMAEYVAMHRTERPRDSQVEAAVVSRPQKSVTLFQIDGTGLSTTRSEYRAAHKSRGWSSHATTVPAMTLDQILDAEDRREGDTHFLVIDVEGAEGEVLAGVDLRRFRPWVVVVESTAPLSVEQTHAEWEPLLTGADYEFCLFDGVSRFYVAKEHAARLGEALSYPACALDQFVDERVVRAEEERDAAAQQVAHWREIAVTTWADALVRSKQVWDAGHGAPALQAEIDALKQTLSWRITLPLRKVRGLLSRIGPS